MARITIEEWTHELGDQAGRPRLALMGTRRFAHYVRRHKKRERALLFVSGIALGAITVAFLLIL